MISYIKCSSGIEMVGIYIDNDARLQWYAVDANEMVKKYNVHSANQWIFTVFYARSLCFLFKQYFRCLNVDHCFHLYLW